MRFGATENGFGVAMVAYSSHPDLNGLGTWWQRGRWWAALAYTYSQYLYRFLIAPGRIPKSHFSGNSFRVVGAIQSEGFQIWDLRTRGLTECIFQRYELDFSTCRRADWIEGREIPSLFIIYRTHFCVIFTATLFNFLPNHTTHISAYLPGECKTKKQCNISPDPVWVWRRLTQWPLCSSLCSSSQVITLLESIRRKK